VSSVPPLAVLAIRRRLPGVKAFTADPYRSSRSVNEFYDELYKLEAQLRLYNERARTDKRKVEPPDTQRLAFLRAAKKEMDSRQAYIKDMQWNESLSPAERKKHISAAQSEMTNIALLAQGKRPIPAEEAGLGFDPAAYTTPRGYKRAGPALSAGTTTESLGASIPKY